MRKRRHSQLTGLILDIQMFTSRMQVYCSVSAPVALFFFGSCKMDIPQNYGIVQQGRA